MQAKSSPSVTASKPGTADKPERRRPRRPVSIRGVLVRDGGISHIIDLVDLNYGGCGIEVPVELDVGESITISGGSPGSLSAGVRWKAEGRAGLVSEPIPQDAKERIERRAARFDVPG